VSWVRLDDGFYEHPKLLGIPRATRWVWVAGLGYSARFHQDGLVPAISLARLEGNAREAAQLVDAGLWVPDEHGWRIHDYAQYQPMNGELSRKRSEAGKKGAQARWQLP